MKQNGVARKVSGTFEKRALGVIVMLRRVLIRLLWNSSAGDGTVSLTGVSRYVVRALVMSMPLALFFRICSNCSNCPFCSSIALMVVWAGCYVPNIKASWSQKRRKLLDLKHGPLSEMIYSGSPNFLKILFNTFVTVSVVSLSRVS